MHANRRRWRRASLRLSGLLGELNVDPDKEMRKIGGVIDSMTLEERRRPDIIDGRRKKRIAAGAGVDVSRVNELLDMHKRMASMVKSFSSQNPLERMRTIQQMTNEASSNPFGMGPAKKGSTGKRLTAKEREAQRKRLEKIRRDKKRKKK